MSNSIVIRKISYPQFVLQSACEDSLARRSMKFICGFSLLACLAALGEPDPIEFLRPLPVLVGTPIVVYLMVLGLNPYRKENAWRAVEAEELGVPLLPARSWAWGAIQGVATRLRPEPQAAPSIEASSTSQGADLKPLLDLQARLGGGDALAVRLQSVTGLMLEWDAVKDTLPGTEVQRIDFALERIAVSCRAIIEDSRALQAPTARDDFAAAITSVRDRMARSIEKAAEQRSSGFSAEMRAITKAMKS